MSIKNRLFAESWNIAIRKSKQGDVLTDLETPFNILKNNISSWCADPFVFTYKEETYIFAEIYDYKLCRGTIGYAILRDGNIGKWNQVIVEDHHLSYPFIFEYDENVYIIPESSQNNTLDVYKAVDFPDKWEKQKTLLKEKKIVDTTFFLQDDHYYAFTTDVALYDHQKQYLINFSEKHEICVKEINVKNAKMSRMGGNVFRKGNRAIKVCQDCRKTYGGGLIFKEFSMENLDGDAIQNILPDTLSFNKKYVIDGIHTYNANSEYEVIDIKTKRFNVLNFVYRLRGKLNLFRKFCM